MRPEASFESWRKAGEAPTGREIQHQKPHLALWHSPLPYLFGVLVVMLGLIAFALIIIIACSHWNHSGYLDNAGLIAFALIILARSHWKHSGYLDNAENTEETGEAPEVKQEVKDGSQSQYYSEVRLAVIMAGEEKPTFLATPISSKT